MAEWRWGLAPLQSLLLASFLLLVSVLAAMLLAVQEPWLGVTFEPAGDQGVRVVGLHPEGPALGRLYPGDLVQGIWSSRGYHDLSGFDPVAQPHAETTFADYNRFLEKYDEAFQALIGEEVAFHVTEDTRGAGTAGIEAGTIVPVVPAADKPVSALPLRFWLLHLYGGLACVIALSVWVFMPRFWPARLLALSGLGMFVATWSHSLRESRELLLPAGWFHALMRMNHLGFYLLLVALLVLVVIYPRRTPGGKWIILSAVIFASAVQVNETLQLTDLPLHTFYLPLLVLYLAGLVVMAIQWFQTRHRPTERGALRWVFLSVLITMGAGLVLYYLPVLLNVPPIATTTTAAGLAVTLYVGFAMGILRYRLFQLDRWWFMAWAWFAGGLAVLLVDVLVMSFFGVSHTKALGLAVIIVGWVYFPARQWLWHRVAASAEINMEHHVPSFVEALYVCDLKDAQSLWVRLLQDVFQPLSLSHEDASVEKVKLVGNGARLLVPSLVDETHLCLLYGQNGRRLFGMRDRNIAEALLSTAQRLFGARLAQEEAAEQERRRMMRDLHDDVGGRLLTLIHRAPQPHYAQMARSAMVALRHAIYALDKERKRSLYELIEDWIGSSVERMPGSRGLPPVVLPGEAEEIMLSARHYVNLRRVLDEALTNALKYGDPDSVTFAACFDAEGTRLCLSNLVAEQQPRDDAGPSGHGLTNLRTRMRELDGELVVRQDVSPPRFCLEARLPLVAPAGRGSTDRGGS